MQRVNKQLDAWGDLLLRFLKTEDEQVSPIACVSESGGQHHGVASLCKEPHTTHWE